MGTYVRVTAFPAHDVARELRRSGMPYKRIASRIGVSASSVYAWTKDIELTEEEKSFNLRGPRGPQNPEVVRRRAESWAARCRAARVSSQEEGRRAAGRGIGSTGRLHAVLGGGSQAT